MTAPTHIRGRTVHRRRGSTENSFGYGVDYLCIDPETQNGPALFSIDRFNLFSIRTSDHGGVPKSGRGAKWVRQVLSERGIDVTGPILLVAQPRVLGHVFNPVSFWFCLDADGDPRVVIAEVSNTFGDRHSYICKREDGEKITASDELIAEKVFHVSPFQPIAGAYKFRFDFGPERISVRIDLSHQSGGLVATLVGPRTPLTNRSILMACLRRPFGSRRVLTLIHWQALKLWWKGARYRVRPEPPKENLSG